MKKQEPKPSYKERILKKKSALSQATAALTVATAMASISQQAEAALIVHTYDANDASFTDIMTIRVNPSTGEIGISGPDTFTFKSSGAYELTASTNGGLVNDFVSEGDILGSSTTFFDGAFIEGLNELAGTNQFIGFQLENQGSNMDETWFGFFETQIINVNSSILLSSTINDSGGPVNIPEPSTSLFGGLALLFTVCCRKRRA